MIGRHTNRGSLRLRSVVTPEEPEQKRNISPAIVVAIVVHAMLVTGLAAWKIPTLVRNAPRSDVVSATVTFAGLREPIPASGGGGGGNRNAGGHGPTAPRLTVAPAPRPKLEMPPLPQPQPRLQPIIAVETPGPAPFSSFQPTTPPSSLFGEGGPAGNGTGNGIGNGSADGVAGNGAGTGRGAGDGTGEGFGGANYVRNPQPRYPAVARQQGWEGTTVLRVEIQADGKIGVIQIVQSAGHKALDDAAIEAVRAAQFQPARHNGTPITSWVEVPVTFRLNRG
jgi:protein TonB